MSTLLSVKTSVNNPQSRSHLQTRREPIPKEEYINIQAEKTTNTFTHHPSSSTSTSSSPTTTTRRTTKPRKEKNHVLDQIPRQNLPHHRRRLRNRPSNRHQNGLDGSHSRPLRHQPTRSSRNTISLRQLLYAYRFPLGREFLVGRFRIFYWSDYSAFAAANHLYLYLQPRRRRERRGRKKKSRLHFQLRRNQSHRIPSDHHIRHILGQINEYESQRDIFDFSRCNSPFDPLLLAINRQRKQHNGTPSRTRIRHLLRDKIRHCRFHQSARVGIGSARHSSECRGAGVY